MLLLDSKIEGWNRVRGRIEQMGSTMGFNQVNKLLNSVVKPIVYPTCIQVSGDTTTMNVVNADITG